MGVCSRASPRAGALEVAELSAMRARSASAARERVALRPNGRATRVSSPRLGAKKVHRSVVVRPAGDVDCGATRTYEV
jgi:hypothetical protein